MNQRLSAFIEYLIAQRKVYNVKDFADQLPKSKSQMSEMLSGKRVISDKTLALIGRAFPECNTSWIKTGEGEMLKAPEPQPAPAINQQNVNGDNTINGGGSGDDARVFKALYTEKCKENEALNLRVAKLMARLMEHGIDIKGC